MVTKPSGNKVNQIILQRNLNRSILLANLLGRGLQCEWQKSLARAKQL